MKGIYQALLVLGIASAILLGFLAGQRCPQNSPVEPIKERVDTLFIYDTIMSYKPIYVDRVKLDSILIPVVDSIKIHDTTYIYLQREQVVWQDSLSRVYASGILPQVDSVRHFRESEVITIEKTIPVKIRSRWGLGVQAGMGVGKDGLTPYVGVGVSYIILSW